MSLLLFLSLHFLSLAVVAFPREIWTDSLSLSLSRSFSLLSLAVAVCILLFLSRRCRAAPLLAGVELNS